MPYNKNAHLKPWSLEWLENDEGKKQIEEIVRPLRAQLIQELQFIVDKTQEAVMKKIGEAFNTCREMTLIIKDDFRIDPNPEDFKNFMLDKLEQLYKTIKPPKDYAKFDEFTDSFTEQIDSITKQINMDGLLRAYARQRKEKYYSTEKWYSLFTDLINNGYIDTRREVFDCVMEYKLLPVGANEIQWRTSQADALFFQKELGLEVKYLNRCFRSKNGKSFHEHNRSDTKPKEPLPTIIKKFTDTLKA